MHLVMLAVTNEAGSQDVCNASELAAAMLAAVASVQL